MSGILKSFFLEKKLKDSNNSACKYLTSYNENLRLLNSGLLITESNILKINKNFPNSTINLKSNCIRNYSHTESISPFGSRYFYPKKKENSFEEKNSFSNTICQKQNKKIKPIYTYFPNLTINKSLTRTKHNYRKLKIDSFPYFPKKIKFNQITTTEYTRKDKKEKQKEKSLTTKSNIKENSIEVEKIVRSLIKNKKVDKKKLHHANSSESLATKKKSVALIKNDYFPKEKSISPATYIDYNLKKNPGNKKLFKSYNLQVKCLNNNAKHRDIIISHINKNNRHRLKLENLKNDYNNNLYKDENNKKIEDIFHNSRKDNLKRFHFNLYDYYDNIYKMKYNNRHKYNLKFNKLKKSINENKNLITFDKKVKNMVAFTNKTVKYLSSLSISNRKMLKDIIKIYDVYN